MKYDEFIIATTRLKRFLLCSLVPLPIWLFGDELAVPAWLSLLAMVAVLLTPIVSLAFSLPIARALRQSRVLVVLTSVFIPIAYLAIGYMLVTKAREGRPADGA
jgi:hypothetical protein